MPTFASNKTVGGYLCGEVASALQKTIRRGLIDDALFWATELHLSGYGEYVWKRLRIIASEDVGPASPLTVLLVHALYDNWLTQLKRKDPHATSEKLFLVNAVIELCRAPKSRMVDHAGIVMYEGPRPRREIPDYALDKHTQRGKRMGRGHDHFWTEGAKLVSPEESFPWDTPVDVYLEQAVVLRSDKSEPETTGEQEAMFPEE